MVDEPGGSDRRARIRKSAVATGRGDDGTTGLLYGGRVAKDDARTEAYGTVDEAVAAMGVARARIAAADAAGTLPTALAPVSDLILGLQRDLFVVAAELATNPDAIDRLQDGVTRVDEAMLTSLEEILATHEAAIQMPREFVVPGETEVSAALEVARTVARRAERRAISLQRVDGSSGSWLVPYLNRLADLLWVLAREAEQGEQRVAVSSRSAEHPGLHARGS